MHWSLSALKFIKSKLAIQSKMFLSTLRDVKKTSETQYRHQQQEPRELYVVKLDPYMTAYLMSH